MKKVKITVICNRLLHLLAFYICYFINENNMQKIDQNQFN